MYKHRKVAWGMIKLKQKQEIIIATFLEGKLQRILELIEKQLENM